MAILVSACGLPAPVLVAGYAADGISFGFTDKTVGDHALSAALDRDCAVWRIVRGERICADRDSGSGESDPPGMAVVESAAPAAAAAEPPELLYANPGPPPPRAAGHRIGPAAPLPP
jgi:hypothetical protein